MKWLKKDENKLPELKEKEQLDISRVEIKYNMVEFNFFNLKTSPPDYLTESELLSLMDKNGIGTDASMATHINNICERSYVKVTSNRRLVPTDLGLNLVKGY